MTLECRSRLSFHATFPTRRVWPLLRLRHSQLCCVPGVLLHTRRSSAARFPKAGRGDLGHLLFHPLHRSEGRCLLSTLTNAHTRPATGPECPGRTPHLPHLRFSPCMYSVLTLLKTYLIRTTLRPLGFILNKKELTIPRSKSRAAQYVRRTRKSNILGECK